MVGGSLNNHLQNYKVQGHHIRQLQEHPTSRWRPKTRSTKLTASRAVAAPAMSAISWIRPFYWILGNWGTYQDNAPSAFKSAITSSSGFAVSSYLDLLEGPYNLTVSYLILQVLLVLSSFPPKLRYNRDRTSPYIRTRTRYDTTKPREQHRPTYRTPRTFPRTYGPSATFTAVVYRSVPLCRAPYRASP